MPYPSPLPSFFKQKTAYEIRPRDWSSDVCSSDLVSSRDVYGGTYRLFRAVLENFGLTFSFVETSSVREIERAVTRHTRLVWIESPTNPLLRITDIRAAAKIAHHHGALCLVDNTFASPFFQRPLGL